MSQPDVNGGVILYENMSHSHLNNKGYDEAGHTGFEPAFSKNSGFNLPLGTTAGTVSEGNHTHSAYEPIITPKSLQFNYNFGTTSETIAEGNHTHSTYEPKFIKNSAFNKYTGTSSDNVSVGNHAHTNVYELVINTKYSAFNCSFGSGYTNASTGDHTHSYSSSSHPHSEYVASTHPHSTLAETDHNHTLYTNSTIAFLSSANNEGNITIGNSANMRTWLNVKMNFNSGLFKSNGVLNLFATLGMVRFASNHIWRGKIMPEDGTLWWDYNFKVGCFSNGTYSSSYDIYTHNAWLHVSDSSTKTEISALDTNSGLTFISNLNPVQYKWIEGNDKYHYGLIAQELEDIMTEDFGALIIDENSYYGIRYDELIAPIVKAIQELTEQVEALEE